jgi:hypothetical protein
MQQNDRTGHCVFTLCVVGNVMAERLLLQLKARMAKNYFTDQESQLIQKQEQQLAEETEHLIQKHGIYEMVSAQLNKFEQKREFYEYGRDSFPVTSIPTLEQCKRVKTSLNEKMNLQLFTCDAHDVIYHEGAMLYFNFHKDMKPKQAEKLYFTETSGKIKE